MQYAETGFNLIEHPPQRLQIGGYPMPTKINPRPSLGLPVKRLTRS